MNAEAVAAALITPRRPDIVPPPAPAALLDTPAGPVAVHIHGAPTASLRVLHLHGWESDHRDMLGIAARLPADSYHIAPDMQAHGASPGTTVTIPEAAAALRAVADTYGPFDLVIAHSIGAAVAVVALAEGLPVGAAVLLTPPGNYARQLTLQAAAAGAPRALIEAAIDILRRRIPTLDRIDSAGLARKINLPTLVVVAGRDKVLDPGDGRALAEALPRAERLDLAEASHRSVLKDPTVTQAIAGFLHRNRASRLAATAA